jgi:uncharacterized membrane protein
MHQWKLPALLTASASLIGLGLQLWYWPQLPDRLATHFDLQGNPAGWMNKPTATLLAVGLVTLLPLVFGGISLAIWRLPTHLINLRRPDYWLAAERREVSLRWLTCWLLWFAWLLTSFMILLNHLTFLANRHDQPLSAVGFTGVTSLFLLVTLTLLVLLIRRFR